MSLIQTLVNKVIQLNDRLNYISLNARKIEDLPPQVEADFNSLIHVSRNGISEKLSLSVLQEAVSEGSVKPRLISVGYLGNPTFAELAQALNARRAINVLAGELPLFHFYDANVLELGEIPKPSYRFFTNKKSPNTYGIGGITIESSNLIFVSETKASIEEIETMEGTQIIDLGEIGTANPWDILNEKNPNIAIQDSNMGYRLVKTLVDGVSVRYLFLGVGGDYGVGGLQSVSADFDIQSGEIQSSGDTIATKIEITFSDLGVATIAEVTDAMVTTHINGLGLVKSKKEFYVVSVEDLRYIITDLPEGLVNITEDQLLKFTGSGGGIETSVIFPDTKINYVDSKSFTIEEGVKVLTFKKNGSTISIDWTQVGNVITYNGLEDLNTEDYFIYNGIKAVSIVDLGDISGKEDKSNKGIANGYAPLDAAKEVPYANTKSISVKNSFGIEQFKVREEISFDGVSFDATNKKISIQPLLALSAYLDVVNGNDLTGAIENPKRPFKTIEALFFALGATTGETFKIFISGGTVPVIRQLPNRNLIWEATAPTTLDFTLMKLDDGVTDAQTIFNTTVNQTNNYAYDFKGENISLKCLFAGKRQWLGASNGSKIKLLGNLNNIDWESDSVQTNTNQCIFLGSGSNLVVNNFYDNISYPLVGAFRAMDDDNFVRIKKYYKRTNSNTIMMPINQVVNAQIDSIEKVGEVSGKSLTIYCNSLRLGNVSLDNNKITPSSRKVEFFGTISASTSVDLIQCNYISGTVKTTGYMTSSWVNGLDMTFENFNGKLSGLIEGVNARKVIFINSNIETTGNLLRINDPSTYKDGIVFRGLNQVTTATPETSLFAPLYASIERFNVRLEGNLKSNVKSYGANVDAIYPLATFKEKLNEVTVRDKRDLVNRVLDSNMNYIVDGIITLSATDRIIVPIGGLSISGYGFDVSAIKATSANSIIFSSPIGGSGNLFISNLSFEASGTNSKVFQLTNAGAPTGGADAIELNVVNFDNCTSLGELVNFRQGLWNNVGVFGVKDGLTISGTWSGGFRSDLTIVRNFGVAGTVSTLFKAGADLLFKSRFWSDLNADFKASGEISNFTIANFDKPKLYQLKGAQITRNGLIDDTQNYTNSITAFTGVCDWSGNNGLKNSAEHPYSIKVDRMPKFASEALAIAAGLTTDDVYIDTSLKTFKVIS